MAGARDAALDLVEYEHQVALVANVAQRLEEGLRRGADTALALNRLDEETRTIVIDEVERGVDVVERRIGEARQQRVEALAQLFLIGRSEEHTSELQSLMRISYAVFCLKKKTKPQNKNKH